MATFVLISIINSVWKRGGGGGGGGEGGGKHRGGKGRGQDRREQRKRGEERRGGTEELTGEGVLDKERESAGGVEGAEGKRNLVQRRDD